MLINTELTCANLGKICTFYSFKVIEGIAEFKKKSFPRARAEKVLNEGR